MKILHLYLTREVLASLLMTVAVFTFVLLLGNVLREVLAVLLNKQASLLTVLNAIGLLIPWLLVFALPMGLLTATLLVFGRFSADHELTAVRAGGVSLVALISPVLLLSVAFSVLCTLINLQLAPQCRVAYKRLLPNVGMRALGALLTEKTFIKDFPGYVIYIDKLDGALAKEVLICKLKGQEREFFIHASSGRYEFDRTNNVLNVWLHDAWTVDWEGGRPRQNYAGDIEQPIELKLQSASESIKLSDMTFSQLRNELRELEERFGAALPFQKGTSQGPATRVPVPPQALADLTMPVKFQMHRQVSQSFACLVFTLVGIPLGIRAHRRETTVGIAMALVLVTLYYSFFILGQALETRAEWSPHLIVWIPNFLFEAVGAVLLWRANRGV